MDIELIAPTVELHDEWLANLAEWDGVPQAGTGAARRRGLDLRVRSDFATWVDELNAMSEMEPTEQMMPATNWWIVDQGRYLGAIDLRHGLNYKLAELGGHIGYGVRPSVRRRGVAAAALAHVVVRAGELGLAEVLITCDEGNIASRRTAESAGGLLARIRPVDDYAVQHGYLEPTCHYWINTSL